MMISRRTTLGLLAASAATAGSAAAVEPAASTLVIKDLSPKFLAFYEAATREKADPDRRWALWKELYGFAAVPPTPEGQAMARRLLDAAWDRYPTVMDRIRAGAAGMTPSPQSALDQVVGLLKPDKPVTITLLAYVGGLEPNAFTAGDSKRPVVAIPIEMDPGMRAYILPHELTHAVQIGMGVSSGAWERSIGVTALSEGLAMRVAHALHPDRSPEEITSHRPGWFAEATAKRRQILADVRDAAALSGSDDVHRFTIGKGPAGIEREAYYAGWVVVGALHDQGLSWAQIARIPEADAPARLAAAIDALLAAKT
ncbi:hypothetical protein [Caulobacter mirabilis]|uniref:DUF2268 domain-containing protein n=1 Tax=Caulobacter mirabilis TaxID=69666 RepID=A0A2D2AVL1_9CAUL|nr:hypothetical protein [Caulobacter mirabilis]ATQ42026.1 hypothetical protein CSW64_06155 [Caulobacter mirabilis]